jgi:thiamine-monophosphate kinase
MTRPPSRSSSRAELPEGRRQSADDETLADLGEWELIRRLGAFAPPGQFSDDAALLAPCEVERSGSHGCRRLVLNTDVLVDGLHFSDATTTPAQVGWRSAAANLSDLAAMGCTEVEGITVGLVAPAATPWSWVEGVYRGLSDALAAYGGVLLGGDCSGGMQRMLAVAAVGTLPAIQEGAGADGCGPWGAIRRGDGRPGDALVCTGPHGLSRLGLALLQGHVAGLERITAEPAAEAAAKAGGQLMEAEPLRSSGMEQPPALPVALMHRAIEAHQRPKPRFDAVRALHRSRPEGLPWRVGGCDSSDGLAAAVAAIASSSDCGALLNRAALPLDPAMAVLPQAQTWCLEGGEDFELVLALQPAWAEALAAALPGCSLIGELTAGSAGELHWAGPAEQDDEAIPNSGYRHFG